MRKQLNMHWRENWKYFFLLLGWHCLCVVVTVVDVAAAVCCCFRIIYYILLFVSCTVAVAAAAADPRCYVCRVVCSSIWNKQNMVIVKPMQPKKAKRVRHESCFATDCAYVCWFVYSYAIICFAVMCSMLIHIKNRKIKTLFCYCCFTQYSSAVCGVLWMTNLAKYWYEKRFIKNARRIRKEMKKETKKHIERGK